MCTYQICVITNVLLHIFIHVPDKRHRIHLEVVSVRRGHLGFWESGGGRVRGGMRKGRSVYKQPETEVDGSCNS
jgi:hypothetical protein